VEAAYLSINVLSWQNLVLGDPLYTPYLTTTVTAEALQEDREYKLIRYAESRFPDPAERTTQLLKAADQSKNGSVYEMFAFAALEAGDADTAREHFKRAKELFDKPADQLRQVLNLVEVERRMKDTAAALTLLRQAKSNFADLPESKAIDGLLVILDPPPPPATQRKK
jgi:hypothetical protein